MRIAVFLGFTTALLLATSGSIQAQVIDHSHPTAGNNDLVANQNYDWGPVFLGGLCRLTDKGSSEVGSVYASRRVNITQFHNDFEFQILSGGPGDTTSGAGNCADGITFTIQNAGPDALGSAGAGLGYQGILHSIAIKFDCVPNPGDPSVSSTGLFINGQPPIGGQDLLRHGIALRSQHPFRVDMRYDGTFLIVQIRDLTTEVTAEQSYRINIPGVIGSRMAYVGFTAATGLGTSAQDIHKWYYASEPLEATTIAARHNHRALARLSPTTAPEGVTVAAWPTVTVHPHHLASMLQIRNLAMVNRP